MTPYGELLACSGGRAVQIAALLMLFAQIHACVTVFRSSRRAAFRGAAAAQLAAGLFVLSFMLDAGYAPDYLPPRVFPPAAAALIRLPWLCWAAVLLAEGLAVVLLLRRVVRDGRRHLSDASVKEAVDHLPVGICFGRTDGTVVLANVRMTDWCRRLTGAVLSDYDAFRRALGEAAGCGGESLLVRTEDGRALLFTEMEVEVDGGAYRQLTAADVTEQYRITEELEAKNARLRDIRLRMKAWGVEASSLVMSREILTARTTVHDEVGHVLLRARHYFEHPEAAETQTLLALTRQTNELLLREAEEPDDAVRDALDDALALARGIGVTTVLEGRPPEDAGRREFLARAVRECAMNAAKHAGADRMTVTLAEEEGCLTAVFRNNGAPPADTVAETGGLRTLRRLAEEAGGQMSVRSGPAFSVKLRLPGPKQAGAPEENGA